MLAAVFLTLTGADNQPIEVNPALITTLQPVRHQEHFAKGVKCLVFTDGRFIAVKEDCAAIDAKIGKEK